MNVNEQLLQQKIDPFLTSENLSAICSIALAKQVTIKKAYTLTGGCLNRVIGIDLDQNVPSVVLKATPQEKDDGFFHEFIVLSYFNNYTNMPVATPLYFDDSGRYLPGTFFVMKKVQGVVMHQLLLHRYNISKVMAKLSHIVVELHQIKYDRFGAVEESSANLFKDWQDFWLPRFDQAIKKVTAGGHVSPQILQRINDVRPYLSKLLQVGTQSTLTHYDIWSGNIMLLPDDSDLKISGFLDVQGFWADYARELSFMEMFGLADSTFYKIYKHSHQLDDTFHIRKDLYNLKMHLKHIHMYPDQMYYRRGAEQCLHTIENEIKHI
jgi:fructosamine-3-kinase